MDTAKTIPIEQAQAQVGLAVRRLALLHLAFAETLVEEFGDERGRELIVKAIRRYGQRNGEEARKAALKRGADLTAENYSGGKNDYPSIGAHDRVERAMVGGESRIRAYGCGLAKVWKQYGGEALGRLYCLIDPAQVMTYSPEIKLIHTQAEPDGDPFCELVYRPTTEAEREAFACGERWEAVDFGNE